VLPFWASIAVLSLVQGSLLAAPGTLRLAPLERLRRRGWALIPPASVVLFVLVAGAAQSASAQALTYLALLAVPLLAALALGWLSRGARPLYALFVVPLFAIAWVDRGGLAGEGAALALSGLSCVALGVLLAAVTPPRWLAAGILAMAASDTAFVVSNLLRRPNNALNAAHPAAGLPRLQSAVFGSAVMGYGDLFVAALLGGLLAAGIGGSVQRRAALLTALLALAFDLLFFLLHELPATVPVALTLLILSATRRRGAARRPGAPRPGGGSPRIEAKPHPWAPPAAQAQSALARSARGRSAR
jgi:hypothetical protein